MNKNVDINLKTEHTTYARSFTTDDTEAVEETLRMVWFVVGRGREVPPVPAAPAKPGRRGEGRAPKAPRVSGTGSDGGTP